MWHLWCSVSTRIQFGCCLWPRCLSANLLLSLFLCDIISRYPNTARIAAQTNDRMSRKATGLTNIQPQKSWQSRNSLMPIESWKSLFDWGATLLVFLTFAFGTGALITGNIINSHKDEKLRQFDADLTEAKSELACQQKKVEELRQDNLNLELKALSLQKEILTIGPREKLLSGETRRELIASLKPFAGQKVDIQPSVMIGSWNGISTGISPIAEERDGLAKSLIVVLKDAGWTPPAALPNTRSNLPGSGVSVHISANASPSTRGAAQALVSAFGKVPLAVNGPPSISENLDENTILLVVHPKPK